MKVDRIITGPIGENCWIIVDGNLTAAVIDPGDDGKKIVACIRNNGYKVEWILLTHNHFDHVGALAEVQQATGAKIAIHGADAGGLDIQPDLMVAGGDILKCGELSFLVVHTPGHTPGGVLYICGNKMFSGDTLFYQSIGRTDLPGGDFTQLRESLLKIRDLPYTDLKIYPGHMRTTTLVQERESNPFFGI